MKTLYFSGIALTILLCAVPTWAQNAEAAQREAQFKEMQDWAKDFSEEFRQAQETVHKEVQRSAEIIREEVDDILNEHGEEIAQGREQLEHHLGEIREWLEQAMRERNEEIEHFRRELTEQVEEFGEDWGEEEEEEDWEPFEESYRLEFVVSPPNTRFAILAATPYYHIESEMEGHSNEEQKHSGTNEEFEGAFEISGTLFPLEDENVFLSFEGNYHSVMTSLTVKEGEGENVEQEAHHGVIEGSARLPLNQETVIYQQDEMTVSVRITKDKT